MKYATGQPFTVPVSEAKPRSDCTHGWINQLGKCQWCGKAMRATPYEHEATLPSLSNVLSHADFNGGGDGWENDPDYPDFQRRFIPHGIVRRYKLDALTSVVNQ